MQIVLENNPLAAELFCYPPVSMEIIFYIPSHDMEFFPCLPFVTHFFLWYLCFPG